MEITMKTTQKNSIYYLQRAIDQCKKDIEFHKRKTTEALFMDLTAEDHIKFYRFELKDKQKLKRLELYMKSDSNKQMLMHDKHMNLAVHLEAVVLPDLANILFSEKLRNRKV